MHQPRGSMECELHGRTLLLPAAATPQRRRWCRPLPAARLPLPRTSDEHCRQRPGDERAVAGKAHAALALLCALDAVAREVGAPAGAAKELKRARMVHQLPAADWRVVADLLRKHAAAARVGALQRLPLHATHAARQASGCVCAHRQQAAQASAWRRVLQRRCVCTRIGLNGLSHDTCCRMPPTANATTSFSRSTGSLRALQAATVPQQSAACACMHACMHTGHPRCLLVLYCRTLAVALLLTHTWLLLPRAAGPGRPSCR